MKKRKLNYKNIIIALFLIISILIILSDISKLTIVGWITGVRYQLTWYGLISHTTCWIVAWASFDTLAQKKRKI